MNDPHMFGLHKKSRREHGARAGLLFDCGFKKAA
jgi:hypothetical protein